MYFAYGLEVASDIALPELRSCEGGGHHIVTISAGHVPKSRISGSNMQGPYLQFKSDEIWLNIPSVVRLHIRDGKSIVYSCSNDVDKALLRAYLLGSGLGGLLLQQGLTVIHGSTVEIGDSCLMCVGESGAGKSTMSAGFLQRGHRVVADDVSPITDDALVIPGIPHIKVWQTAADALGISTQELPQVAMKQNKFRLPLDDAFVDRPLPLRTIVELCPANVSKFTVESVSGLEKIAMVQRNLYRPEFVHGLGLRGKVFQRASQQMSGVSAFRVHRPLRGFELDAMVDTLLEISV